MPLVFVEIRLNEDVLIDEWLWFPNLETARCEAAEIATEITRQTGVENVCIDIKDQHGHPITSPADT